MDLWFIFRNRVLQCIQITVIRLVQSFVCVLQNSNTNAKRDQSWVFFGRNGAKAGIPVLWPPHAKLTHWKRLMLGGIGGKRRRG